MDVSALGNAATSAPQSGDAKSSAVVQHSAAVASDGTAVVQTADPVKKSPSVPSLDQVKQAVHDLNNSLAGNAQGVQFSIDQSSKRVVVKVVDQKTNEVIRQIPTEDILELSRALDQKLGKLINQQA